MHRVVIDANVFVSAALAPEGSPARVIQAAYDDLFEIVISLAILQEVDRVFRYPKIIKKLGWSTEEVHSFTLNLMKMAKIITPGSLTLEVITDDESDNRYLECAVEGRADFIVSGDTHLLSLKHYETISIVTPKEFLAQLKK